MRLPFKCVLVCVCAFQLPKLNKARLTDAHQHLEVSQTHWERERECLATNRRVHHTPRKPDIIIKGSEAEQRNENTPYKDNIKKVRKTGKQTERHETTSFVASSQEAVALVFILCTVKIIAGQQIAQFDIIVLVFLKYV